MVDLIVRRLEVAFVFPPLLLVTWAHIDAAMPAVLRSVLFQRLCEDDDGNDEHEESSDENDGQCSLRLGPKEHPG